MVRETQPGEVIGIRHWLDEALAAGAFGRVWRAWDQLLQVSVAVKEVWLHQALSLTDFGIAVARNDQSLTAPGTFIGTMEYLAPERARGFDGQAPSALLGH